MNKWGCMAAIIILVVAVIFMPRTACVNVTPSFAKHYLPLEVGQRWVYDITIRGAEPVYAYEKIIPQDDLEDDLAYVERNRGYFRLPPVPETRKYRLIFSIAGEGESAPIAGQRVLVLRIEEDSLGIFEGRKQVLWVEKGDKDGTIFQVETFSSAEGNQNGQDPFTARPVFFAARPWTVIWWGADEEEEAGESLIFKGLYSGKMLFIREVKAFSSSAPSPYGRQKLDEAFSEKMWFARGKGLFRLEQKRGKDVSMVWELQP